MPKNRSVLDQDAPLSEVTPFQLLVGVILLLVLCLTCFLLGVYVGKREATRNIPVAQGSPGTTVAQKETTPPTEGHQSRPVLPQKSSTSEFAEKPSGPRKATLTAPPSRTAASAGTSVPAAPTENSATPVSTGGSSSTTASPEPEGSSAATNANMSPVRPTSPASPAPGEATSGGTTPAAKPKSERAAPAATSAAKSVPSAASESAVSASTSKGRFTIQVIAYGTEESKRASEYKSLVEANSNLKVELVPSEDGKHIRVFVGRFSDRPSAAKACDELKKRDGFKSAFVKDLGSKTAP